MSAMHRMPLAALLGAFMLASAASAADIELTAPDGRRVLLKEDGTWRYADDTGAAKAAPDAGTTHKKPDGEAILSLEGKIEGNRTCRLQLRMVNNLSYEIRSLVPEFGAYRQNGVMYDAQLSAFAFIKPGDSQRREVRFNGLDCKDIARVLVGGGDRCEMGDLDKFTPGRGMCLARVSVAASEVLPFEKKPAEAPKPDAKDAKGDSPEAKDAKPASAPGGATGGGSKGRK